MDRMSWQRACTKCLSDNIEKVGDNYWYCSACGGIFKIAGAAGESNNNLPSRWEETPKPRGGKQAQKQVPPEPLIPPNPGTLEATDSLDFPIL